MEVTAKAFLYRLYISYIAIKLENSTVNNKPSFVIMQCASHVFLPQHGHPQGSLQRRNKIMTDQVKDVQMWSQKQNVEPKTKFGAKNKMWSQKLNVEPKTKCGAKNKMLSQKPNVEPKTKFGDKN